MTFFDQTKKTSVGKWCIFSGPKFIEAARRALANGAGIEQNRGPGGEKKEEEKVYIYNIIYIYNTYNTYALCIYIMRTCWGVHKAGGLHAWWFIDAHVAAPICRPQLLLWMRDVGCST